MVFYVVQKKKRVFYIKVGELSRWGDSCIVICEAENRFQYIIRKLIRILFDSAISFWNHTLQI